MLLSRFLIKLISFVPLVIVNVIFEDISVRTTYMPSVLFNLFTILLMISFIIVFSVTIIINRKTGLWIGGGIWALYSVVLLLQSPQQLYSIILSFIVLMLNIGIVLLFHHDKRNEYPYPKQFLFRLFSVLFGIILAIIPLEIGSHFILKQMSNAEQEAIETVIENNNNGRISSSLCNTDCSLFPDWSNAVGWSNPINSSMTVSVEDIYHTDVDFNEFMMRGPTISQEKPEDVYRIMIIGDSYIEALQVEYEDTVMYQLQMLLDNTITIDGHRFEVVGIGSSGWGTAQYYLYYHHAGYQFEPDIVVVLGISNDVTDNYLEVFKTDVFRPNRGRDFEVTEESIELVSLNKNTSIVDFAHRITATFYTHIPSFVVQHSNILRIGQLWLVNAKTIIPAAQAWQIAPPEGQSTIYSMPIEEPYIEAWRRTELALALLEREVANNGGNFIFAYTPSPSEILYSDVENSNLQIRMYERFTQEYGIDTIDLVDDWSSTIQDDPWILNLEGDGHFTPEGHRVFAENIYQWLVNNDVIDSEDS